MEDRKAAAAERELGRLDGAPEVGAEDGDELVVLSALAELLRLRRPSGESWPSSQPDATQRSLSVVVECVSKTIAIFDARLRRAMISPCLGTRRTRPHRGRRASRRPRRAST